MKKYLCGSTVRLIGEFYDFENNPIDVSLPRIILYDYKYNRIDEFNLSEEVHKLGTGAYFFDYITDMSERKIIYEFYGEIDGSPALNRGVFFTKFIN